MIKMLRDFFTKTRAELLEDEVCRNAKFAHERRLESFESIEATLLTLHNPNKNEQGEGSGSS